MKASRVVVTGAGGFLGRAVLARLSREPGLVLAVQRSPAETDMPGVRHVSGELRENLHEIVHFLGEVAARERVVIHLAGLADAARCRDNPGLARRLNVDLTRELLDALGPDGMGRFVFPSTGYVYGESGIFSEEDPPRPNSIYAQSKQEAEELVRALGGEHGTVVARLSNVYGPGSAPGTVTGRLVQQARGGEPLQVRAPSPVRDFIHVDDVAEGLVRLAGRESPTPLTVNLSTGCGTSVGELAVLVAKLSGLPYDPHRPSETPEFPSVMVLANDRLFSETGWRPSIPLEQGLLGILRS